MANDYEFFLKYGEQCNEEEFLSKALNVGRMFVEITREGKTVEVYVFKIDNDRSITAFQFSGYDRWDKATSDFPQGTINWDNIRASIESKYQDGYTVKLTIMYEKDRATIGEDTNRYYFDLDGDTFENANLNENEFKEAYRNNGKWLVKIFDQDNKLIACFIKKIKDPSKILQNPCKNQVDSMNQIKKTYKRGYDVYSSIIYKDTPATVSETPIINRETVNEPEPEIDSP